MTLAQNHRPPLNGSKVKLIILLFIILGFLVTIPSINAAQNPPSKTFSVAMILPLHLYEYNGHNVNRANIMLDYYQGFFIALKDFEKNGLKIKLYIYDNEHDTAKTIRILARSELKDMDLIITPILIEHLHILNHFSCKYQIPVFSPFTAADSLFPNNPLFFNAAPALKTKAEIFYDYYRKTNPDKSVLIIKNEAEWDKGYGQELINLLETKNDIKYKIVASYDLSKADSNYLPKHKNYIVFHNGESVKSIKSVTSFLDKQKSKFEIVGDYKPLILKQIPDAKRKAYDIKIISSDYTNPLDSAVILKNFKIDYKALCKLNPSRYSIIGHDQASFICEALLKYDRFRANDFTGDVQQYYSTKFVFKKDKHCNQNKGLFILKISGSGLLEEVIY